MWRKRNPHSLLVGLQIGTATMENSMEVPQKTKTYLSYDPAVPLLRIYPKDLKTHIPKDICTPMFITALFLVTRTWKLPKCPMIDDWIKRLWYIHTMEYYSARRDEILPFVTT